VRAAASCSTTLALADLPSLALAARQAREGQFRIAQATRQPHFGSGDQAEEHVVTNSSNNGVFGSSVTNVQITGSSIKDNDAANVVTEGAGIKFVNLFGSCAISNTTVSGTKGQNVSLENSSGNLAVLAVINCVIGPNPVGTGAMDSS
jgi:hypothetical protein